MARYCFYCGRELTSGEKCTCRSGDKASASGPSVAGTPTGGPSSGKSASSGTRGQHRSGSPIQRFFQAFNPFSAAGSTQQSARSKPKKAGRPAAGQPKTATRANQQITLQSLWQAVRQFGSYLSHPADSVRTAVKSGSRRFTLVVLLLQGICGGFFLLAATSQPLLFSLLMLNFASFTGSIGLTYGISLFVQGFAISIAAGLLMGLLYYLVLRFLYRHPVAYLDLLTSFSPACLYFTLFLLLGALTLSSSFFSAILLLVAGFAVAAIAQYLAISQVAGFDNNRSFILVTFIMLIYTSILSFLLNLSLPVLNALLEQTKVF
jgi:hypothetical protein